MGAMDKVKEAQTSITYIGVLAAFHLKSISWKSSCHIGVALASVERADGRPDKVVPKGPQGPKK